MDPLLFNEKRAELAMQLRSHAAAHDIALSQLASEIAAGSWLTFPTAPGFGLSDAPAHLMLPYIQARAVLQSWAASQAVSVAA